MPRIKYPTPPAAEIHGPARAQQLAEIINAAIDNYAGTIDELEKAIGVLMMGDYVGWKVLVLVHSKSTVKNYERILGITFKEFFEAEGRIAERNHGYRIAKRINKFWKVVSGDEFVENRREFGIPTTD